MTVKVSKPAINVREELADLRKPTGVAGEAMLRAETPQEQFQLIGAGRRNLLINGAMEVAQRGTTFDCNAGSGQNYTVDRWFVQSAIDFTATQGTATLPNGQSVKTLKMTADSAQSVWADPYQMIEDYKPLDGQYVTMSAWVRTNIQGIVLRKYSDKNLSDEVTPDGEWHYITATFVPDFSGGAVRSATGSAVGVTFNSSLSVAQNDYFEFTQVQLELGKVATPFEHRSYGEELALAQRFYTRLGNDDGGFTHLMVGSAEGTATYVLSRSLSTRMRAVPTLTVGSGVNGYTHTAGPVSVNSFNTRCSRDIACISANVTGTATLGETAVLYDAGANGYMELDAEL